MRAHAQAVVGEERHHRVRRGITVAYLCSWHRRARVLLATSVSSLLPERGEGVVDGGRAEKFDTQSSLHVQPSAMSLWMLLIIVRADQRSLNVPIFFFFAGAPSGSSS